MNRSSWRAGWVVAYLVVVGCSGRVQSLGDEEGSAGKASSGQASDFGGVGSSQAAGGVGSSQAVAGVGSSQAVGGVGSSQAMGGASTAQAGVGAVAGAGNDAACPLANLNVDWEVIAGCIPPSTGAPEWDYTPLRCAFPQQLNSPEYGPFVACCPLQRPFGCPSGTPQACFPSAAEAAQFCGTNHCQLCVPWSSGAGGTANE
jgi:hypothetical protein